MTFRGLEWLFPVVITLHNAEEAIWLATWPHAPRWRSILTASA